MSAGAGLRRRAAASMAGIGLLLAAIRPADAERPPRRAASAPVSMPPQAPAPETARATARNLRIEIHVWDVSGGQARLSGFEAFRAVEGAPATASFGRSQGYLRAITIERSNGGTRTVPRTGFAETGIKMTVIGRAVGNDVVTVAFEVTVSELASLTPVQALEGRSVELPSVPIRRFGGSATLRAGAEHRIDVEGGAAPSWIVLRALLAN